MRFLLLASVAAIVCGCGGPVSEPVPSSGASTSNLELLATFAGEGTVAIAVDDDAAYVTTDKDGETGSIMRVSLRGAEPQRLASVTPSPFMIAIDESWAYFTVRDDGSVRRVKKSGGPVELVAAQPAEANSAEAIALDADHVYWTAVGGVFRAPKRGGPAVRIAEEPAGASALAVDGGEAFWISRVRTDAGGVFKVSTSGGSKIELATAPIFGDTWTQSIAVSGRSVFFPDASAGRVYRVDRSTGELSLVAEGQDTPVAIEANTERVFWSTGGSTASRTDVRSLKSAPVVGGPIETLVETRQTNIYDLAVNRRGAYFTDYVTSGSVYAATW